MNDDVNTIHDFRSELRPLLIIGGFEISKKSTLHFIINILFLIFLLVLYIFLGTMAIITIVFLPIEADLKIQAFYTLCFVVVAIYMPASKLACTRGLSIAVNMIKIGIYNYNVQLNDTKEYEIKRVRIDQIKSVTSICAKMCYISACSNVFLVLVAQLFSGKADNTDSVVNPYLPLPLYMPFDTKDSFGYIVAFALNAIYVGVLYTSCICFMQTFVSCLLQFVAHLEVLNHSLSNIENRARSRLRGMQPGVEDAVRGLWDDKNFQNCLIYCLRENILHHQAILRFSKAIRPYIESMNALAIFFFSVVMAATVVIFIEHPGIKIALIISCASQILYFFLMCYLGEMITNKSEEILNVLYSTPWPYCDENFKMLLRIFIINVKRPIIMGSTLLNTPASLETFADMVSKGYKIVNVLRTNM